MRLSLNDPFKSVRTSNLPSHDNFSQTKDIHKDFQYTRNTVWTRKARIGRIYTNKLKITKIKDNSHLHIYANDM